MIKEKNAQFNVSHLPIIQCDRTLIGMVFYNMINNGIKFNRSSAPTVRVASTNSHPDYYIISVIDNGIGINQKYKDKIFENYSRLASSDEFEGSGIGLSTTLNAVKKNKGNIWNDLISNFLTQFDQYSICRFRMDKANPFVVCSFFWLF